MKQITNFFLLTLLLLFGATSCRQMLPDQDPSLGDKVNVGLDFNIPLADTMLTYAAADDASRENNIVRLDVFAFDQTGARVAGLEGHVTLTTINMIDGRGRAMIAVTIPAGETSVSRQFGLIANGDPARMDGITSKSLFDSYEITTSATMPTSNFVMSDLSALNTITTTSPTINLSLRRTVARVDVVLRDQVTNFTLTSVRLVNARQGSFLMGKTIDPADASSPLRVPATAPLGSYAQVNATTEDQKRNFTGSLYCFENYNANKDDQTKTTAVIIGGLYKGVTSYYRVNLHDNARLAQVRRNYVYKVNIVKVNGPGNPDPASAINDAPQNIDYAVIEWDYSQHSEVVFDGSNYLGLSSSTFTMPRVAGTGSLNVVSNLGEAAWQVDPCAKDGTPIAQPSWATYVKKGSKIEFTFTENTDGKPRVAYIKIKVSANARLAIIATLQQYHTDQPLLTFTPSIITAPSGNTLGKVKTQVSIAQAGSKWTIEHLHLLDDKARNWCRLSPGFIVGQTGTTTSANQTLDLSFDVDAISASLLSRSAVLGIKVVDVSGFEELRTVTISQGSASAALTVSRLYIAKTAEIDIEKIAITTTGPWTATLRNGDAYTHAVGNAWLSFTDDTYTPLADPKTASGVGPGSINVKFDACPANTVRNGYIVVASGSVEQWIRVHQGDYRTVVIDGYQMLDRNLGATESPMDPMTAGTVASDGYKYMWGRRPDGYEVAYASCLGLHTAKNNDGSRVQRQPVKGDPAWGRYITTNNGSLTTNITTGLNNGDPKNFEWLTPDASYTPADQRDVKMLWDARATSADLLANTNLTPVRTEYDPCPDGWRVPTAREMENILLYGARQLTPLVGSTSLNGRYISSDQGRYVYFPTSNNRLFNGNVPDPLYTSITAGWYWTSSYSSTSGPYAVRILRDDIPLVSYTPRMPSRPAPKVYPNLATAIDNLASHYMSIRCVRDRQTIEELSVDIRRRTINNVAQGVSVTLSTANLTGSWTATSSDPWLTVSPASGSGGTALDVRASANEGGVRTASIRITTTSGTIATTTIVQLDETAVQFGTAAAGNLIWWRDRNVGATRCDYLDDPKMDKSYFGYHYFWGSNVCVPREGPYAPAPAKPQYNSWNLSSAFGLSLIGGVSYAWSYSWKNFPYPIKNPKTDPCPDGWRVPTYAEWMGTFGSGNGYVGCAKNGQALNIVPPYANSRQYMAEVPAGKWVYLISGGLYQQNFPVFPGPAIWTSTTGNAGFSFGAHSSGDYGNFLSLTDARGLNEAQPVRCVQDINDDFK
ncbi:MAG: BACON domain-containing carbohydrate-binding protein [Mucinivorans sp.]